MHELQFTKSLLEIVNEKARKTKAHNVTGIRVVIGELSGVEPDCVEFYFDIMKKEYNVENAVLDFEIIPALLKCRQCQKELGSGETFWLCPECGSAGLQILKGSECYVESIEVDE